jgi:hypothetical protein
MAGSSGRVTLTRSGESKFLTAATLSAVSEYERPNTPATITKVSLMEGGARFESEKGGVNGESDNSSTVSRAPDLSKNNTLPRLHQWPVLAGRCKPDDGFTHRCRTVYHGISSFYAALSKPSSASSKAIRLDTSHSRSVTPVAIAGRMRSSVNVGRLFLRLSGLVRFLCHILSLACLLKRFNLTKFKAAHY